MSTSIQSVGAQTQDPSAATTPVGQLGKNDFLNLLVTQLRNQDPLNPMSGTEFASQLAQFSSVEQLSNINTNLEQSLQSSQLLSQAIGNSLAASLVGKEIKATGSALQYSGSGSAQMGYTLTTGANTASVSVYDQSGACVRTMSGGTDAGDNTLTWDGKNDAGQQLGAGKYTFKVNALDARGSQITASPFVYGTISAVRYKSDGTYFVIDGVEVPLSDVLEVLKG